MLSWDLTGFPEKNIIRIGTENRRFKLIDDIQGRKMIRIALHPHKALEHQLTMICKLKDQGYTFLQYKGLIYEIKTTPYTKWQ